MAPLVKCLPSKNRDLVWVPSDPVNAEHGTCLYSQHMGDTGRRIPLALLQGSLGKPLVTGFCDDTYFPNYPSGFIMTWPVLLR